MFLLICPSVSLQPDPNQVLNISLQENCKAQEWKMYNINILSEIDNSDEFSSSMTWKQNGIDFEVLHAQPHTKENSYSRQKLAQSSFEVKHSDASDSEDLRSFDPSNFSDASLSSLVNMLRFSIILFTSKFLFFL